MRIFRKALASTIALCIMLSLFSVVPVQAVAPETGTTLNRQNITFVDESKENTDIGGSSTITFAKKLEQLYTYSNYENTSLEMYGFNNSTITSAYGSRTNQISTIDWKPYQGTGTDDIQNKSGTDIRTLGIYEGSNPSNRFYGSTYVTNKIYDSICNTNGTTAEVSLSRVDNEYYDGDFVVTLNDTTAIDTFLMFNHPNATTAVQTYGVFVSDDPNNLFSENNLVFLWDYYNGYSKGYKFNYSSPNCSEGQVWNFSSNNRPIGKYVGVRFYDCAGPKYPNFICIYSLGIFGSPIYSANSVAKIEEDSSSSLTAQFIGKSGGSTSITDVNGNNPEFLSEGSSYTFTATEPTNADFYFAGWYDSDGVLKSTENTYNIQSYAGEMLTAKYVTNHILYIEASDDVSISQNWNGTKDEEGNTSAFPNVDAGETGWAYDSTEDAMKITNTRSISLTGGAAYSSFTVGGNDVLTNTLFEPYTTYKCTVIAKLDSGNSKDSINPSLTPTGLILKSDCGEIIKAGAGYTDCTVYFNSGAANFGTRSQTATSYLCSNIFNINIPTGATLYIKSWEIEKVNDIKITNNNTIVTLGDNAYSTSNNATAVVNNDTNCYGGETTAKSCSEWLVAKLNEEGLYGAVSDNDTISFTVEGINEAPIKEVTVNGVLVTPVDGVYTANVGVGVDKQSSSDYAKSNVIEICATAEKHECEYIYKTISDKYLVDGETNKYYKYCYCGATSENYTFEPIIEYNNVDLTKYTQAMYDKTIWDEDVTYNETVMFYEGKTEAKLLYPIDSVISVRSYDMKEVYLQGEDFTISDGKIVLTENSTIRSYADAEYLKCLTETGAVDYNKVDALKKVSHLYQVNITYTHSSSWDGVTYFKPEPQLDKLAGFKNKLNNNQPANIVFYGDSVTVGWNASGLNEPTIFWNSSTPITEYKSGYAQMYPNLGYDEVPEWACSTWSRQVEATLKNKYGEDSINYYNKAVASTKSEWGSTTENLEFQFDGITPDLLFIGFGLNELSESASSHKTNIAAIIEYARSLNKDCSIVLVSAFYPSRYKSSAGTFSSYNLPKFEKVYYELAEEYDGVVVAPVYSLYESILQTKETYDYTSNIFNHPNDFGCCLYADTMSVILSDASHTCEFTQEVATEDYLAEAATCTTAAKYYYSCECGKKGTETFDYGEVDATNHVGGEELRDDAEAGHTTPGHEGNIYCLDCGNVKVEGEEIPAQGHVGATFVEEKPSTCKTTGNKAHYACETCGKNYESIAADAAEIEDVTLPLDPAQHDGATVEVPKVPATKDDPGKTAGTKYECCDAPFAEGETTYYVEFVCDGTVVYTTEVVENGTLSDADLAAVEAAKFTGIGYIFAGWDHPIEGTITGTTTFTATYERDINTKYNVTVNGSDAVEYTFDTKITVKTANEEDALWNVNGVNYDIGAVAVFYSFGAMDIVAEEITDETIKETPFVSILKTFTENGEYVAIIHAYAAGKEISEIGAIYWNSKFTFESRPKDQKISIESNSPDAMTTLYGIMTGQGRSVKAYAIIDGVEYTSKAKSAYFN